ncbi:VOC family protein (plasmid) [Azospirillum argentinense]|uniref:VOC family protein n=1 Tax=Azospirillum argentinense TaxID=2970906 RepID=A0A4D8PMV5_9PROT|nr:VOC family protein [Azospirillum argentinense]QCN97837.1 VOC family protein [Azospirillum argentinense]
MEPTIYLFFNGTCLEAMTHYAETLGGEVVYVFRNGDAPDADSRMPGGDHLVMNMMVKLGATTVMASDSPDSMYSKPQGFRVQIAPPSLAEFDRIFAVLAKDARAIEMPPGETFWAERFAMVTDRFGTPWMLNHTGAKCPDATAS